uniref:Ribosomal protein S11 n=1 Tax=Chloropicon maureeniae TaxID=1461542 RepID=A0A4D6C596_9CHLO|nr:ribosomal protein S11 [Chloropicon maureeniae]QBX98820.1 ribosomal protein S11 [Chloropicon maureeniae]
MGIMRKEGILHIHSSSNNTILSLTDLAGAVQAWASCGSLGFRKAARSTPYASEAAGEHLGRIARQKGFSAVRVYLKGMGRGRDSACRGIAASGLQISKIMDSTRFPHNGCRPPKKRRV